MQVVLVPQLGLTTTDRNIPCIWADVPELIRAVLEQTEVRHEEEAMRRLYIYFSVLHSLQYQAPPHNSDDPLFFVPWFIAQVWEVHYRRPSYNTDWLMYAQHPSKDVPVPLYLSNMVVFDNLGAYRRTQEFYGRYMRFESLSGILPPHPGDQEAGRCVLIQPLNSKPRF